jgi:hypothetical protein
MATSTTNYSFTLPEVGGDTDQWGTQLNSNWTLADTTLKTIADSVGDDVTLTGNDYLTISGQVITVGSVDLTADVTGTLPVGSGGTGLSALGTANQVLAVNAGATALEFQNAGSGTVTSVAISGSDGIEIDSGSPITTSGTIALGINATTLSTHLGLGSLATQSSITESQISDLQTYLTASSTATLTNKSGNISQWTNDSGYLTAETNNLSTVSGTLGIANGGTGSSSAATARVALLPTLTGNGSKLVSVNSGATDIEYISSSTLSITESQISDLQTYLTASSTATLTNKSGNISQWTNDSGYLTSESNDLTASVTWANVPNANITQGAVTQHQAALSITESQISDLGTYQTADAGLTSIAGLTTAADKMIYTTASDTYAVATLTSAGRALLDDADAAAQRTTLGLSIGSDVEAFSSTNADYSDATANFTGTLQNGGSNVLVDSDIDSSVQSYDSDTTKNDVANTFTANQIISVTDNTNAALRITQTGTGNALVVEDSANPDSTPFVIDATGTVLIGSTTAENTGYHLEVKSGGNSVIKMQAGDANTNYLGMGTATDALKNNINVYNNSGSPEMRFSVNSATRMRIDSNGNVLVGTDDTTLWDNSAGTTADNGVHISATGTEGFVSVARYNGVCLYLNRTGTDGTILQFRKDGTTVGSISTNANSLPSDRDFKKDINDLNLGLELVKKLKPKTYRYKINEDNSPFMTGLIAQDLEESLAQVGVAQNESWILQYNTDEEENQPKYALDYSKLIPVLTKAIQEQQALIESQQSQIDALTARIEALETA